MRLSLTALRSRAPSADGERNEVVVQTTLNDEHSKLLAEQSFLKFLLAMPYNIFLNVADFNWMFLKVC